MEKEKLICKKLNINDVRTAKQIVQNEELYNQIISREIISHSDLVEKFKVSNDLLKDFKAKGLLSYFTTKGEISKSSRGSKVYYFRDEIEEILSPSVNYYPSVRVRYNLMNKLLLQFAHICIPEKDAKMLKRYLSDNVPIAQIAEEFYMTETRVRQTIEKASAKVSLVIKRFSEQYSAERAMYSIIAERNRLEQLNQQLYDKFKRVEEAKITKELMQKRHIKHFIDHKIPLKYLDCNIAEMEICHLSIRALNVLKILQIEKVEDLFEYRRMDFYRVRNSGKKTVAEIVDWVFDHFKWSIN